MKRFNKKKVKPAKKVLEYHGSGNDQPFFKIIFSG